MKGYAQLTRVLTNQLKKDAFAWNEDAERVFQQLKVVMSQVPVLAMPDFHKTFVVETDASQCGLGAVLMQDTHPIAYYSKTLGKQASNKPIYEKELMAIVFAVLKWKHYLLGRRFVVKMDQLSLLHFLEQREVIGEYQNWMMKLMGFDFTIEYNPGRSSIVADALSRVPQRIVELGTLLSSNGIDWDLLLEEVGKDATLVHIRDAVLKGEQVPTGFTVDHDRLFFKGRFVLARTSPFIPVLLREYHDFPLGGHAGELKTYLRLAAEWYWEGMSRQITNYVRECPVCQ